MRGDLGYRSNYVPRIDDAARRLYFWSYRTVPGPQTYIDIEWAYDGDGDGDSDTAIAISARLTYCAA